MRVCVAAILLAFAACDELESVDEGGSSDTGGGEDDVRCVSLCEGVEDTCDRPACVDACASRLAGVAPLCGTCMLENAAVLQSSCAPTYRSPLECVDACEAQDVLAADPHPVCVQVCGSLDAACEPDCLEQCQARVTDTTALCATCLLHGMAAVETAGCPMLTYAFDPVECAPLCG